MKKPEPFGLEGGKEACLRTEALAWLWVWGVAGVGFAVSACLALGLLASGCRVQTFALKFEKFPRADLEIPARQLCDNLKPKPGTLNPEP